MEKVSVILSWKTNNSIHTSMRRHSRKVSLIRKNLATFINATYHHTSIPHHVTTFRGKKINSTRSHFDEWEQRISSYDKNFPAKNTNHIFAEPF